MTMPNEWITAWPTVMRSIMQSTEARLHLQRTVGISSKRCDSKTEVLRLITLQ
jgi:hypothetical protein